MVASESMAEVLCVIGPWTQQPTNYSRKLSALSWGSMPSTRHALGVS